MPIRIDNELPAKQSLEIENIFVMSNKRADTQDIRPLHIIILNLMPTKIDTETPAAASAEQHAAASECGLSASKQSYCQAYV